tara:strand:- start:14 stop:568 length:555 start_codon:yes stop_codon:yes gene_type:complete
MAITINGNGTLSGVTAGLTASSLPSGAVLQVQTTYNNTHIFATDTSFTDLSGMTCNITPTAASNKVLVQISMSISKSTNHAFLGRVYRDSTLIGGGNGDQANHEDNVWWNIRMSSTHSANNYSTHFVDTIPNDWSSGAITYKVQGMITSSSGGINFGINQTAVDGNDAHNSPSFSNIVLTEIAA